MSAPFAVFGNWSQGIVLTMSLLLGMGFGFVLERAGFGNARKLAYQFYFKDLTVFKVFFGGIVVAMMGLLFLGTFGYIDLTSIYLTPTFLWSGLAGAVIMGVGFALGGY